MKSRISYRSLAAKWLVFFIILSCYPVGTMTGFAAQPASGTVSVDPVPGLQNGQRSDFIMGADVSELYELEKAGRKFYDTDGTEM
ncbi:hypothetical protein K0U00_31190, partial [Paenibacillus sepulcri]|nr:hypothetical protein [Paenibacillus sepulcri]